MRNSDVVMPLVSKSRTGDLPLHRSVERTGAGLLQSESRKSVVQEPAPASEAYGYRAVSASGFILYRKRSYA